MSITFITTTINGTSRAVTLHLDTAKAILPGVDLTQTGGMYGLPFLKLNLRVVTDTERERLAQRKLIDLSIDAVEAASTVVWL